MAMTSDDLRAAGARCNRRAAENIRAHRTSAIFPRRVLFSSLCVERVLSKRATSRPVHSISKVYA
jgi:hypothetical protein